MAIEWADEAAGLHLVDALGRATKSTQRKVINRGKGEIFFLHETIDELLLFVAASPAVVIEFASFPELIVGFRFGVLLGSLSLVLLISAGNSVTSYAQGVITKGLLHDIYRNRIPLNQG
jgi:hypothetical protein